MAKATEKLPTVAPNVLLELEPVEAATLVAILSRIGGSAATSPRKHADAMFEALASVGYRYCVGTTLTGKADSLLSGAISFKDGLL